MADHLTVGNYCNLALLLQS